MNLVKIFGSNMEIGDSYIHVRDENDNQNRKKSKIFADFRGFRPNFELLLRKEAGIDRSPRHIAG